MSSAAPVRAASDAPIPADRKARTVNWSRVFRLFMRALAIVTLARGLSQWAVICAGSWGEGLGFEDLPLGLQASTIFFAVLELVAGVGLWLTSAWGGVVWIIATSVALGIDLSLMGGLQGWVQLAARQWPATAADGVLLLFYAITAVMAARQADDTITE